MPFTAPLPTPITLADGRVIRTLADATAYMTALPARHLANAHWSEAARLIKAAVDDPSKIDAAVAQLRRALRAEGLMGR